MKHLILCAAAVSGGLLAGCGGSEPAFGGGSTTNPTPVTPTVPGGEGTPTVPNTATRAGTQQHVVLDSKVDGEAVSFEVFEPDQLEAGKTYPLILEGHGYGGSRQTARGGFIARLTAAGYYVISIDERGFGESGGKVRVMDPEYEGQDLVQILDWAESLPGLRRRTDGSMMVGSYGGSYGGMYQMLLAGVDPQHRLRVLSPDITPHDLPYSLAPNNVVKSGWGLVLAAGGEASNVTSLPAGVLPSGTNQDLAIIETLVNASLNNRFPEAGTNFFRYHSVRFFCEGVPAGPQPFVVATPDALAIAPTPYPAIDVLFTQGFRDTLFNFNDSFNNYQCLKARGGDVRLLTHQSGHILPVAIPPAAEDALDPFYQALTVPGFQDGGASRTCGSINLSDATFAWFEEKLQAKAGAIDAVITTGRDVCMSLAEGDAVSVSQAKVGGEPITLAINVPQFNSLLGVAGATLGNAAREALLATLPVYTVPAGGAVLAGLPTMNLDLQPIGGLGLEECPAPVIQAACDPILLLAIGHRKAGTQRWDIVDDQLTPVRGFGVHEDVMSGVAERLAEGDQIALLIYGFHAQFPVTWSRDVFVPALNITGEIALPIVPAGEISKDGV